MLSPIVWHVFVPGVCADLSPVRAQDLEFTNGCLARAMFGTVFFFFKTNLQGHWLINVVVMSTSRWPWPNYVCTANKQNEQLPALTPGKTIAFRAQLTT